MPLGADAEQIVADAVVLDEPRRHVARVADADRGELGRGRLHRGDGASIFSSAGPVCARSPPGMGERTTHDERRCRPSARSSPPS